MATITVRNLSERVVRKIKERAARSGRSMEQEVREILESVTVEREWVCRQIEESWKRQKRPTTAEEIQGWIDEMRGR